MSYKYQSEIEDAVDFMKPSYGTEKHQEIQQELQEVYRKAELADRLTDTLSDSQYYVNGGTKDIMIGICLKDIRGIYDEGDSQ